MSQSSQEQQLYRLSLEINFHMTSVALQRGYSSPESCVSYMNSTVAQWQLEASTFNEWRDASWLIMTAILDALQPDDPVPTIDEVIAQLPTIVWPA